MKWGAVSSYLEFANHQIVKIWLGFREFIQIARNMFLILDVLFAETINRPIMSNSYSNPCSVHFESIFLALLVTSDDPWWKIHVLPVAKHHLAKDAPLFHRHFTGI